MGFEVGGCVGEVGKRYGVGFGVGIQPLFGHSLPTRFALFCYPAREVQLLLFGLFLAHSAAQIACLALAKAAVDSLLHNLLLETIL